MYKEYHYFCTVCKQDLSQDTPLETYFDEVKGVVKIKYYTKCSCGGEIEAGFPQTYFGSVGEIVIENIPMGCSPNQIPEMMAAHPGSVYNERTGALITKGFHEQCIRAKERGMGVG